MREPKANCLDRLIQHVINSTNCNKKCLPISYPGPSRPESKCETSETYTCMIVGLHRTMFYDASKICGTPCSTLEYVGEKSIWFDYHESSRYSLEWRYMFESHSTEVYEEALVYDVTGVIGSIGGTLGLFIGFSFRELIDLMIGFAHMLGEIIAK